MARHKVEISGVNTSNIKVLTNEETSELFKKMKEGDPFARDDLINGNLKLVLSIIKKFNNKVDNLDDLFQVGCLGLVKAIDNFDTSYDVKLSTYACPMIIGEIRRYLRDNNTIRVSRSVRDLAYRILNMKERINREEQREPSIEEMAKELEVSKEEIIMSLDAIQEPISLQEPTYCENADNICLIDQVSDKKNTDERWTQNIAILEAMKKLNDKEKMIINKRFFEGRTQMEVAEEIGISQAQVSRLERTAISHIRRIYK